jgi:hypothetical protein
VRSQQPWPRWGAAQGRGPCGQDRLPSGLVPLHIRGLDEQAERERERERERESMYISVCVCVCVCVCARARVCLCGLCVLGPVTAGLRTEGGSESHQC